MRRSKRPWAELAVPSVAEDAASNTSKNGRGVNFPGEGSCSAARPKWRVAKTKPFAAFEQPIAMPRFGRLYTQVVAWLSACASRPASMSRGLNPKTQE